jgi:hypothetical protein
MRDIEELEALLRSRGASSNDIERLRSAVAPLVVHTNHGVIASTISGPIAIGAGALATTAGFSAPPGTGVAPPAAKLTPAPINDSFWKEAGSLATSASSVAVAVSKIVELAAKLL